MPTVAYMIPQQGFRPKTNPLGELNRRGLRGLGSGASSSWDTAPPPPPVSGDLSNTDLLWNWVSSGAGMAYGCYPWDFTCAQKVAMAAAARQQIQSVADNAAYYYPGSAAAQVAQDTATQQEALSSGDVNAIVDSSPSPGPLGIPWLLWAVGAFVAAKTL
jgi:hypothetical protein